MPEKITCHSDQIWAQLSDHGFVLWEKYLSRLEKDYPERGMREHAKKMYLVEGQKEWVKMSLQDLMLIFPLEIGDPTPFKDDEIHLEDPFS